MALYLELENSLVLSFSNIQRYIGSAKLFFNYIVVFCIFALMNKAVTKLFSCCLDNQVVIVDTNFSDFHKLLKKLEPSCHSDRWFSDKFKESNCFAYELNGKNYTMQKLV